jgi:hypothetical protein
MPAATFSATPHPAWRFFCVRLAGRTQHRKVGLNGRPLPVEKPEQESGKGQRFATPDMSSFTPWPSSRVDKKTYLNTLSKSGDTFILAKKYGNTLTPKMAPERISRTRISMLRREPLCSEQLTTTCRKAIASENPAAASSDFRGKVAGSSNPLKFQNRLPGFHKHFSTMVVSECDTGKTL